MAIAYFKCDACNEEHRDFVEIDKSNMVSLGNGRYRFDPNAPKTEPKLHTHDCVCGSVLTEKPDPQAVRSGVLFNWIAD